VRPFSVIIPSRDPENLVPCVNAILMRELHFRRIIVVDDGARQEAERQLPTLPIDWVPGIKPFVFARNINLGIEAAGDDDVILLNDDAVLITQCGFSRMVRAMQEAPEFGVVSAVTNSAGNPNQYRRGDLQLREEPKHVAFVCVAIPRRVLNTVGLLDERFTAYGWDDNDYCRRAKNAGYKLAIYDGCFVDHLSLNSTYRGRGRAGDIRAGAEIYRAKWGDTANA
jgi:GT2 family glycosyltransferase